MTLDRKTNMNLPAFFEWLDLPATLEDLLGGDWLPIL
jgi:hypothetical protein